MGWITSSFDADIQFEKMFWRLLCLTLFCHHVYATNQVCVKEGNAQTLTCALPASWQNVTWQLGGGVQVECTQDGTCTNSPGCQISNTATTSQLTISSVQRGLSLVTCLVNAQLVATWNLTVYAAPSSMMCTPITLTNGNSQINFACSVQGIYPMKPQPICFISHQKTGNVLNGTLSITVQNDKVTCTYVQKLNTLLPRDEQFTMIIAPNVCGADPVTNPNATIVAADIGVTYISDVVSLRLPTVKPVTCPSVGVKAGEMVSCTCYLDDPGYPPGKPRWYSNNGAVPSTGNNTEQVLSIQMTSGDQNPVYVCDVDTVLQRNYPIISSNNFSPKPIFGPDALLMSLTPSTGSYDSCPDSSGITITCQVPKNKTSTPPLFTIWQGPKNISAPTKGQLNGVELYSYQMTVVNTSSGQQTFSCRAENPIYPEMVQKQDQSINIRAPLETAPLIKTDKHPARSGKFDAEVSVGDMLDVTCIVDGGVPNEYDIYLVCPSKTNTAKGYQVINRVEVTQETYGLSCVCGAMHVTGCYKLKSTMTFVKPDTKLYMIIGLSCGGGVVLIVVVVVAIACWRYHSKKADERINKDLVGYDRPHAIGSNGNPYIDPTHEEEVYDEPTPDETPNSLDPDYLPTVDYPYPQNYPYSLSQNYPYPQNYSDGSFDPKNYDKFNGSITDFYRPFNPSDYSQSNYNQSNYNQSMTSGRQASNGSVPYTVAWGHRPLPPNKPEADYLQML
ncbi:uncharacterized protein LOC131939596 isoform X3 [Physella acuta]|uniref:uncharacterized protein LOC131939596 isoform X3 n=1 Tax=Physella acuta TaxID=109671 RepID=UPI0027DD1F15|nr:uncharacterized protein LOC131939596 isoform X3 [Physella acuta]